jgi:LuxR family maltose regulon positive regulatory protein
VSILDEWPSQIPVDIAKITAVILDQAPPGAFDTVESLALHHLRSYVSQGLFQKAIELAEYYEIKFLELPDTPPGSNAFRNRALGHLYFTWSILRGLMCVSDDRYDFDLYQEKFCKNIHQYADPNLFEMCPAPWLVGIGSSRKGAPEEFINALANTTGNYVRYFRGYRNGHEEIGRGELCFYRGDLSNAESFINLGLNKAQEHKEFDLTHRAWFYIMRISMAQGNYSKTEQALKNTEAESNYPENQHANRYINYDISLSWHYCFLGLPENVVAWFKEDFTPCGHPGFIENFGNQIKARYCYATRNFSPLLIFTEEMKTRVSYLFERIELLAMEACVHYKMKNKKKAFAALEEAYTTASPNEIVMPFIEMGKDMRTLTSALLKEPDGKIPKSWLEDINRKSASYAKYQSGIVTQYRKANRITDDIVISPRETEILIDLCHGLSRVEIAANRNLSINTVKMVINHTYMKLGAENLADLIRIAVERKMV